MVAAHIRKKTAGTIIATRQAVSAGIPEFTIGLNSTEIIKIWVTPPPKFPQPAAVALAVPTTFAENINEHQNWLVTNVAPAGFLLQKPTHENSYRPDAAHRVTTSTYGVAVSTAGFVACG